MLAYDYDNQYGQQGFRASSTAAYHYPAFLPDASYFNNPVGAPEAKGAHDPFNDACLAMWSILVLAADREKGLAFGRY